MLPILQFVFSSFWIWAGTVVLISAVASAAVATLGQVVAVFSTVFR